LITDLARLVKAQEYLNAGYQQVIWVDIDVIIVNTKKFRIKLEEGFCFCLEHWVGLNNKKQIIISKNINNSLMVFKSHNTFLDYYVECCLNIVKRKTKLEKTSVGTDFLTKLYTLSPFKVLTNVGLFSPYFLYLYLSDVNLSNDLLKKYFPSDLYAVNLCNSFRNKVHCNISMEDQLYEAAIEKLLRRND
jgi:hypothetical protein